MKYENDYFIIYYNECDKEYLDEIVSHINDNLFSLIDFFNLDKLDKIEIILYDDVDVFYNWYREVNKEEPMNQLVGCASILFDKKVRVLSLKECQKVRAKIGIEDSIDDLSRLIMHEIIHLLHYQARGNEFAKRWVGEGIAIFLSGQYEKRGFATDAKELTGGVQKTSDGNVSYVNYYLIFKYLFATHDEEYIKKLVLGTRELQNTEILKIYDDAKEWINKQNQNLR